MNHYYQIAGLTLKIEDCPIALPKEMEDFEINPTEKEDMTICFSLERNDFVYAPTVYLGRRVLTDTMLTIYGDGEGYLVFYNRFDLVLGYFVMLHKAKTIIYLRSSDLNLYDTHDITLTKDPFSDPTGAEKFMYAIRDSIFFHAQKFGRFAIHSASILYQDKVWLFSAPSGVGKSTHVEQWKKASIACEDFNGDIAMCYLEDEVVYVSGLPWSGTSEIYCNKTFPLGGITFLSQGKQDEFIPLSPFQGALQLIARTISPNWTLSTMQEIVDFAERSIPKIFYGALKCTPTTASVSVIKEQIDAYLLSSPDRS